MTNDQHLLSYLQKCCDRNWIINDDNRRFYQHTQELSLHLRHYPTPPSILLVEPKPFQFLSTFIAALTTHCPLFLGNPHWQEHEWQQVFTQIQPDLILGSKSDHIKGLQHALKQNNNFSTTPISTLQNFIAIPTGGTSGKIRFTIHTWETLTASVRGFHKYFGEKPINSFCVLPLHHVSGLMQFLRSFLTQGFFYALPYHNLKSGQKGTIKPETFFISLVPTQLQFLIQTEAQWLARFDTVLLGGAPAGKELLETARAKQIRLAPTYGMTETASQIVTLKPEDFLQGNDSSGRALPHANIVIQPLDNQKLCPNCPGIISIEAESLCWGYYPHFSEKLSSYITDDLGYWDEGGYLQIIGRNSSKIITGGENVFPAEVEAAILATQLVQDICVIGLPDETWGQAVTAVYVPKDVKVSVRELQTAIALKISKFKQPKVWIHVANLPRNGQGKLNYEQVKQIAMLEFYSKNV